MTDGWQTDPRRRSSMAAMFLPPAAVEETAWDILLALHSDRGCELGVEQACTSGERAPPILERWLVVLEQRQLVTGTRHRFDRASCGPSSPLPAAPCSTAICRPPATCRSAPSTDHPGP